MNENNSQKLRPSLSTKTFKLIIIILLLILPILGFLMGSLYQERAQPTNKPATIEVVKKPVDKDKTLEREKLQQVNTIGRFLDQTVTYSKTSSTTPFNCFDQDLLPNDEKTSTIITNLSYENRSIVNLCRKNLDSDNIVASVIKRTNLTDPKYREKLKVEIYTFYEGNYFSTYILLSEQEGINEKFKFLDWLRNDDILFSLVSHDYLRTKTYVYNLKNNTYYEPTLIEYCTYGIAKGSSERQFRACKTFNDSDASKHIQRSDLP